MQEKKRSNLFQPLVIFQRLFSFVVDHLIPRGFKRVITTSHSMRQSSTTVPMVSTRPNVKRVELQQAHYNHSDDLGPWKPVEKLGPTQAQIQESAQIQEQKEEKDMFVGSSRNNNNNSLSSFEEEERIRKLKGKSVSTEKLELAAEPENVKLPSRPLRQRHVRPLFDVAININEKSDAFIRSRKEAMRRNYSLENETY